MYLRRLFGIVSFALSTVILRAERLIISVFDLFKPEPLAFGQGAPRLSLEGFGGIDMDPATYQRNRHEAGVSRRSAARNT